ncbi:apolipoprotein L3-like [Cetorhinus maximus]
MAFNGHYELQTEDSFGTETNENEWTDTESTLEDPISLNTEEDEQSHLYWQENEWTDTESTLEDPIPLNTEEDEQSHLYWQGTDLGTVKLREQTIEYAKKFFNKFLDYKQKVTGYIKNLRRIADDIDSCHKDATIAKVTGSSIGIAGGALSIAGLIAAPFTAGASLILTGVGCGVGIAGGATNIVASVTDAVNQNNNLEKVKSIMEQYQKDSKIMSDCLNNVRQAIKSWIKISKKDIPLNVFVGTSEAIMKSLSTISVVASVVTKNSLRALRAASGVLAGLLVVWDFYSAVSDAKDLNEGSKTEIAKKIREAVKNIEEELNGYEKFASNLKEPFKFQKWLRGGIYQYLKQFSPNY